MSILAYEEYIQAYPYGIPDTRRMNDLGYNRIRTAMIADNHVGYCVVNGKSEYYTAEDLLTVVSFRKSMLHLNWPPIVIKRDFHDALSVLYRDNQVDRWHEDKISTERERSIFLRSINKYEAKWNATRTNYNSRLFQDLKGKLMQEVEAPPRGFTPIPLNADPLESLQDPIQPESMESYSWDAMVESFGNLSKMFEDVALILGDKHDLYQVERCIFHFVRLFECTNMSQLILHITDCAHETVGVSVIQQVKTMFDFYNEQVIPESGFDFVELLRNSLTNWKSLQRSQVLKHLNFLISCLITLQLCNSRTLSWSVGGLNIFKAKALDKTTSASNVITAAFDSIVFFVEMGYQCFLQKSVGPLFETDDEITQFERDFFYLEKHIDNIECGNYRACTGCDEDHYGRLLAKSEEKIDHLHACAEDLQSKTLLGQYRRKIKMFVNQFHAFRSGAGLRITPESVMLYGDTSIGKSSLLKIILKLFFAAIGEEYSDDLVGMYDPSDKFMSKWKSEFIAMIMDDVCNTKSAFVEISPCKVIQEVINPFPMSAPQAEAHKKGKVRVEPKMVGLTTNKEDLEAGIYSNKPNSIYRRIRLQIRPEVKKEFRISGSHMMDQNKCNAWLDEHPDQSELPDFWILHVEKLLCDMAADGSDIHKRVYADPCLEGGVSIQQFAKWYIPNARQYYEGQKKCVENNARNAGPIKLCKLCDMPACACSCPTPESILSQAVNFTVDSASEVAISACFARGQKYVISAFEPLLGEGGLIDTCVYYKYLQWLWSSPYSKITTYMPQSWLYHDNGQPRLHMWYLIYYLFGVRFFLNRFTNLMLTTMTGSALMVIGLCLSGHIPLLPAFICIMFIIMSCLTLATACKYYIHQRIMKERGCLHQTIRKIRDDKLSTCLKILGWSIAAYTGLRLIARTSSALADFFSRIKPESALRPENVAEVEKRESGFNMWKKEYVKPNLGGDIITATPDNLVQNLIRSRSLVRIRWEGRDHNGVEKTSWTHGLFLCDKHLLTVDHHWKNSNGEYKQQMHYTTFSGPPDDSARQREHMVHFSHSIKVPGHDLRIVYVHDSGSMRNILKWFPIEPVSQCVVTLLTRTEDGSVVQLAGRTEGEPQKIQYGAAYAGDFFGQVIYGNSETVLRTEDGMCGSPWIAHTKGPCILGIHTAGQGSGPNKKAFMSFVTRKELNDAIGKFEHMVGILKRFDPSPESDVIYGRRVISGDEVHPKSFVNYIPSPSYSVLGSCEGGVTPKSHVVEHPWSQDVSEIFGYSNKWGPPAFKGTQEGEGYWKPWYDTMCKVAKPCLGFPGELVHKSIMDYYNQVSPLFQTELAYERCVPLTPLQCINGIPGRKGMEHINFKSSPGFPLTGAKEKWITQLEGELEGIHNPKDLDPMFWEEVERIREHYRRGERYHPIFKACLKDEAKKKGSAKVRLFYAAQLAFVLEIRRLFLPVWHMFAINPLECEQAVGINCSGPEWEELMQHIEQFGKDRIVPGDYKEYDSRMCAQLTQATMWLFIKFAELTGNYSPDDILIMHGLANDMCNPRVAVNGTMVELVASGPSGTPGTVQINGVNNSLYARLSYFAAGNKGPFNNDIALTTYGDDNMAGVSGRCNWNFQIHKTFMALHDIVYTTPDKDADKIVDFYHIDDVDFLKRKSSYIPELGCRVGALEIEDSIMKPLHCGVQSSEDSKVVLSSIIDVTLFESFLHGREIYDDMKEKLDLLAVRYGTAADGLRKSFDDRVLEWHQNYTREI
jgi:hypothetical protein